MPKQISDNGQDALTTRPEDLDHYCRDCFHMTASVDGRCKWCRSPYIGLHRIHHAGKASEIYKTRRRPLYSADSEREQPDVYQQIRYAEKFRLMKGFAIMRGGVI